MGRILKAATKRLASLRAIAAAPVMADADDYFLIHHVPADADATELRARREAAAHLRCGEPYVTLHCAPLKLPSGIRGERWYVLTPALHALIPAAEASYFVERITSTGGTHGHKTRIAKKKKPAGKPTREPIGKPTRKRGGKRTGTSRSRSR